MLKRADTGVLVIGEAERKAIKAALDRAREKPVALGAVIAGRVEKDVVSLLDRHPGMTECRPRSENVMLGTYRAAISFEHQPSGLCRHLSVSSALPGRIPSPEVLLLVASEFGCPRTADAKLEAKAFMEEFQPRHFAVNFVWPDKASRRQT